MKPKPPDANPKETVRVLGVDPVCGGVSVLRENGDVIALHKSRDGEPIPPNRSLVAVSFQQDGTAVMETVYTSKSRTPATTNSYRNGWDALWGADKQRSDFVN